MTSYNDKFYEYNIKSSSTSAEVIYPIIQSNFSPKSVIDFGCGRGTWLNVALKQGARKAVGLDGAWNADKQINQSIQFRELKDHSSISGEKYDIAISLEVFEHLSTNMCDDLIETMTGCSDVIVFSAAFVDQRGTDHINEQYPSFWAKKFRKKGFYACDIFRPTIWGNSGIDPCYQQNMFLYINKASSQYESYLQKHKLKNLSFMDCMHPEIYLKRSGSDALKDCFKHLKRVLKKRSYK